MKIFSHLAKVATVFTLFLSANAVAEAEVLRHLELTSRDHYYINIDNTETPFKTKDVVGVEHTNYYHVLGFEGESFIVILLSEDDSLSYSISGEGFSRIKRPKGEVVTVNTLSSWITIETSAHPETAEYQLIVKKHRFE
ncbi:hypothetical protein [Vibrio sp. SCSIO 43137]|uniref:hypothetical protein n=1 Tax=Vibrio sp. SCSIO 43137 TaxID=3021011 RepID=UPI002307743F|nr:hypothetical protein [Vibrio sp. SCSIO 43137]WCE28913.1 hypothetical protein PK654_11150 [Vibrio sp. SCSIO 43137]